MDLREATQSFEAWLGEHVDVVEGDLERKHEKMARSTFSFFRGSYYRFLQQWPDIGGALTGAPEILVAGDVHLSNFGTWRDAEGRLAWGLNDFDEAHRAPYALDLVRLAASGILAAAEGAVALHPKDVCDVVLAGYTESVDARGEPILLAEDQGKLRDIALAALKPAEEYWPALEGNPAWHSAVPHELSCLIESVLPEHGIEGRYHRRTAGVGSLGQPRLAFIARWRGGRLAREAKALRPSAAAWLAGDVHAHSRAGELESCALRARDPWLRFGARWVVRRLSPDSGRIEIEDLPRRRDEARLLYVMGWELANVHVDTEGAAVALGADLSDRANHWLRDAAYAAVESAERDAREWRKG